MRFAMLTIIVAPSEGSKTSSTIHYFIDALKVTSEGRERQYSPSVFFPAVTGGTGSCRGFRVGDYGRHMRQQVKIENFK